MTGKRLTLVCFAFVISLALLNAISSSRTSVAAEPEPTRKPAESSELIAQVFRAAAVKPDDFSIREVVASAKEFGGHVAYVSTGGRVGAGYVAVFDEKGKLVSLAKTQPIRAVETRMIPGVDVVVVTREVSASGTGLHRETIYIRPRDRVDTVIFETTANYVELGPHPDASRSTAVCNLSDGRVVETIFSEDGRMSKDGAVIWGEPKVTHKTHRYDKGQQKYIPVPLDKAIAPLVIDR